LGLIVAKELSKGGIIVVAYLQRRQQPTSVGRADANVTDLPAVSL